MTHFQSVVFYGKAGGLLALRYENATGNYTSPTVVLRVDIAEAYPVSAAVEYGNYTVLGR
jgi:hypothetical protein